MEVGLDIAEEGSPFQDVTPRLLYMALFTSTSKSSNNAPTLRAAISIEQS
jgi:hypothetical protein